jgi:4-amino-4-deoxy-L-arabinose transferase-like glycosyltransferase
MKDDQNLFDRGAIGVSLICLVHCLAMPVLAILFPLGVFAAFAENHWHWLFLMLAAPLSILAVYQANPRGRDRRFLFGVFLGIALLSAGVLIHIHALQVGLTVLGAISLFAAHVHNLRRRRITPG